MWASRDQLGQLPGTGRAPAVTGPRAGHAPVDRVREETIDVTVVFPFYNEADSIAEVMKEVRVYGELHRFIPAPASSMGARITEVPIQTINRPHGPSNYGIGCTVRVLFDLLTVKFLLSYLHRPLQLFGLIGLMCLLDEVLSRIYYESSGERVYHIRDVWRAKGD